MSEALAVIGPNHTPASRWVATREEIELLKRTVAVGTTDDEFSLFTAVSKRLGLDPFLKQIYCIKRQSKKGDDKMTIQIGIDGFRLIADRTGQQDGHDGPYWCGDDGVWVDVWLDRRPPSAAKILIHRKGCSRPFTGIATFNSYKQTNAQGELMGLWGTNPSNQIAKCAEALGLRKAFPAELSGVVSTEEMEHVTNTIDAEFTETKATVTLVDALALIEAATTAEQLTETKPTIKQLGALDQRAAKAAYFAREKNLPKTEAA